MKRTYKEWLQYKRKRNREKKRNKKGPLGKEVLVSDRSAKQMHSDNKSI